MVSCLLKYKELLRYIYIRITQDRFLVFFIFQYIHHKFRKLNSQVMELCVKLPFLLVPFSKKSFLEELFFIRVLLLLIRRHHFEVNGIEPLDQNLVFDKTLRPYRLSSRRYYLVSLKVLDPKLSNP